MTQGAKKQEISVTISPEGKVEFHLEGFGKACDDYIKLFRELLNAKVEDTKYTSEYYQTTVTTSVDQKNRY